MQSILSTQKVRLVQELPELQLREGDAGIVRNSWHYPQIAYEVEFRAAGVPINLLLLEHQVYVEPEN